MPEFDAEPQGPADWLPSQDVAAECRWIGALLRRELRPEAGAKTTFYRRTAHAIFEVVLALDRAGQPVTVQAVAVRLRRNGDPISLRVVKAYADGPSMRPGDRAAVAHAAQDRERVRRYCDLVWTMRRPPRPMPRCRPHARRRRQTTGRRTSSSLDPPDDEPPHDGRRHRDLSRVPFRASPVLSLIGLLPIAPAWRLRLFQHLPERVQAQAYDAVKRWARREWERSC